MRKAAKFILAVVILIIQSCSGIHSGTNETESKQRLYIVEKKYEGPFQKKYLKLSDVETRKLVEVQTGDYTYSQVKLGDTISWSFPY